MQQVGLWMRENPVLAFLAVCFIAGCVGDCGVEFARSIRR